VFPPLELLFVCCFKLHVFGFRHRICITFNHFKARSHEFLIDLVCREAFKNDVLRLDLLHKAEDFRVCRLISTLHHVFFRDEKVWLQSLALFENQTGNPHEVRIKFAQVSRVPVLKVSFSLLENNLGLPSEL